jgi:signal peptidase II
MEEETWHPWNGAATSAVEDLVRNRFFLAAGLTLFVDLATKVWALRALSEGPIHHGRVSFVLAHNVHGAMGFLHQLPTDYRRGILIATAMLASVAIVFMARRAAPLARFGLALILGGAMGNLIDRALRGAVVDFIDVMLWPGRHWHTFNVADVAIVVGAVLVALNGSRERRTTTGCVVP